MTGNSYMWQSGSDDPGRVVAHLETIVGMRALPPGQGLHVRVVGLSETGAVESPSFDSCREQPFQQTIVITPVKHSYRKEGKMQR